MTTPYLRAPGARKPNTRRSTDLDAVGGLAKPDLGACPEILEGRNMTDIGETTFSGNIAIDAAIKEMLPYFNTESQRRMRKKILSAKKAAEKHHDENTDAGARHVFRELIPAFELNKAGFAFEYEKRIQGKTPDWLDDTAKLMVESYTYERGGSSEFVDRVASAVADKCNNYKEIMAANSLRFMVAIYLDFATGMTLDECREESEDLRALFADNDSLWAILLFTETQAVGRKQQYGFLCLCRDLSCAAIRKWPFQTISLNQ